MVMESKYTASPSKPLGSNMAMVLTMKDTHKPSATGKSMLIWPWRISRQAALVNTSAEKNITGRVSTHEAQRNKDNISGVISPGPEKYGGKAYIITCIMQKPATAQRHKLWRSRNRLASRAAWSCAGTA
ncbi:MAG: hypothetical protein EBX52_05485, partial [Proteobacteria bacterium]|nr:hypothetical protein [Pseudomonadota bacterium]